MLEAPEYVRDEGGRSCYWQGIYPTPALRVLEYAPHIDGTVHHPVTRARNLSRSTLGPARHAAATPFVRILTVGPSPPCTLPASLTAMLRPALWDAGAMPECRARHRGRAMLWLDHRSHAAGAIGPRQLDEYAAYCWITGRLCDLDSLQSLPVTLIEI